MIDALAITALALAAGICENGDVFGEGWRLRKQTSQEFLRGGDEGRAFAGGFEADSGGLANNLQSFGRWQYLLEGEFRVVGKFF